MLEYGNTQSDPNGLGKTNIPNSKTSLGQLPPWTTAPPPRQFPSPFDPDPNINLTLIRLTQT